MGIFSKGGFFDKIGHGIGKFAKGVGHDIESIGKFGGKQIDKLSSAGVTQLQNFGNITGGIGKALSSPFTFIAIAVVGVVVLIVIK